MDDEACLIKDKEKFWKKVPGAIQWIIVVTIVVALWCAISLANDNDWLIGSIPIAIATWVLLVVRHGYVSGRHYRWNERQKKERVAEARLNIPPDVKEAKIFELVEVIDKAQHDMLLEPPDYQGRYRVAGITVAILPSLALTCLTLQVLLQPKGGPWGVGLIISEALLLGGLIFLVWTSPNPPLRWVTSRLRAELLRREQYLCLAGVGPYLGLCSNAVKRDSTRRIELIAEGNFEQLKRLLPMSTPTGEDHQGDTAWIDALWSTPSPSATCPDLLERMKCYLYYRIGKQIMYFSFNAHLNESGEQKNTMILKAAVILAPIIAVAHAVTLAFESSHEHHSLPSVILTLMAFLLPPISAAILALQNIFNFRPLAAIYLQARHALLGSKINLQILIENFNPTLSSEKQQQIEKQFQVLVLRTEQVLTYETEKWSVLMLRNEHEVSA